MFPFPYYSQPPFQGSRRGRGRTPRRGRGNNNRGNRFPSERQEAPPPPSREMRTEKPEQKELTRTIPGLVLNECLVQLSVTLRCLGFLVQSLFLLLEQNQVVVACTRYQLYRIVLYAAAIKILKQSKRSVPWYRLDEARPEILERIQIALETDLRLPKPFVDYLSSLGDFELNSSHYSVFIPVFNGPHPLFVTIDNLWGTVTALANPATPLAVRQTFYINSPLPGAIWQNPNDPTLTNPNDFINAGYDVNMFLLDLEAVNALNTAIRKRKWPELQAEKVDFSKSGDSALLASSSLLDTVIRCNNAQEGQIVEGSRTDFTITSKIKKLIILNYCLY